MCPGRNLAEGTLWLGIASILAAFNITPELDKAGVPILPDAEYTSGVMRYAFHPLHWIAKRLISGPLVVLKPSGAESCPGQNLCARWLGRVLRKY